MTERLYPVVFECMEADVVLADGEVVRRTVMVPHHRYERAFAKQFHVGDQYTLVQVDNRNMSAHNAYFAEVGEAFKNLPESISARFPSAEHLRKWALIETGWFDEKEIECPDGDFARKLATFIRVEDEYARISIHRPSGNADHWKVIIRRAKSQSRAAMPQEDVFKQSKSDVLDLLTNFIGTSRKDLRQAAGRTG